MRALANFEEAGVADRIHLIEGDAGHFLRGAETGSFEWVFLDSERSEYVGWWPDLLRITAPDGLIIVDNAVDKATELEAFVDVVRNTPGVRQVLVPIGNGELVIHKA